MGYTAKVAGTEWDIQEPQAVFLLVLNTIYAFAPDGLRSFIRTKSENNTQVWLVNTGWIKGPYGVGERIALRYTRALIDAVLEDQIPASAFTTSTVFDFQIPDFCPEVPAELLNPKQLWKNPKDYDVHARKLKKQFGANLQKLMEQQV